MVALAESITTVKRLRQVLSECFDKDVGDISLDASINDLACSVWSRDTLQDINKINVILEIEDEFHIETTDTEIRDRGVADMNIRELARFINEKRRSLAAAAD